MKTIIIPALVAMALTAGAFAGVAQAKHTPSHHSHKGAHTVAAPTNTKGEYRVSGQSECPRTVIVRSAGPRQSQLYCPTR